MTHPTQMGLMQEYVLTTLSSQASCHKKITIMVIHKIEAQKSEIKCSRIVHSLLKFKELHIKILISLDIRTNITQLHRTPPELMNQMAKQDITQHLHLGYLRNQTEQMKQIDLPPELEQRRNGWALYSKDQLRSRAEERSSAKLIREQPICLEVIKLILITDQTQWQSLAPKRNLSNGNQSDNKRQQNSAKMRNYMEEVLLSMVSIKREMVLWWQTMLIGEISNKLMSIHHLQIKMTRVPLWNQEIWSLTIYNQISLTRKVKIINHPTIPLWKELDSELMQTGLPKQGLLRLSTKDISKILTKRSKHSSVPRCLIKLITLSISLWISPS